MRSYKRRVIPAKAGIQSRRARAAKSGCPLSRAMTLTRSEDRAAHFERRLTRRTAFARKIRACLRGCEACRIFAIACARRGERMDRWATVRGFDLILRGGRVIDPASGIDGLKDVGIRDGKIAAVQSDILPTSRPEVVDVTGKIVLPGLIDTHAHVYQYVTGRFGVNADMVGVQSGVTTLVDQGGPSCMTLPGFRHFVAEKAQVAHLRLPLGLSRRRPRRPLLPQSLQPRLRRYRRHREGGDRQPRSRPRHQGPCRDRRLRPLGHSRDRDGGRDRTPRRPAGLCAFRPALGLAGERHQRRGRRYHSSSG